MRTVSSTDSVLREGRVKLYRVLYNNSSRNPTPLEDHIERHFSVYSGVEQITIFARHCYFHNNLVDKFPEISSFE